MRRLPLEKGRAHQVFPQGMVARPCPRGITDGPAGPILPQPRAPRTGELGRCDIRVPARKERLATRCITWCEPSPPLMTPRFHPRSQETDRVGAHRADLALPWLRRK